MSRRAEAQRGFTLVELLMAIILGSIFSLGLFAFFFSGVDSARTSESQALAQGAGRTAIDRIVRDARQAISPDTGLTAPVIALTPTSVELYVDPSRSLASTVPRPQKVRYSIVANQLIREYIDPIGPSAPFTYSGGYTHAEILIESLQNGAIPAFVGVTRDGVSIPAAPTVLQLRSVAQISVRLLTSQKTGNKATTLELSTDVALRNAIPL